MAIGISNKGSIGITVTSKGNWLKSTRYLEKIKKFSLKTLLHYYGDLGVEVLMNATPKDTGRTSESWSYELHESRGRYEIVWTNSNTNNGLSVAVLIQYGHATKNGGWVYGIDFINPALAPVFEDMANVIWEEVTSD